MALAWKAGWVNSPQGFESPILRQQVPDSGLPDLTHLLRTRGGPPSLSGQGREVRQPLDPGLVDLVVGWVAARLGVAA